jgi:DDE superfamily endonuclease
VWTAPLVIFKGENILSSWIPPNVDNNWHFSCNSKGWTNNIHGQMWLEKCFEPATKVKLNGQKHLLLCDGHDSHISTQFVSFRINHNIILFLLPPHSSHLLQPLDVSVFGPMKQAMASNLSRLYTIDIACLQKVEWIECYIKAQQETMKLQNVLDGWRAPVSPL